MEGLVRIEPPYLQVASPASLHPSYRLTGTRIAYAATNYAMLPRTSALRTSLSSYALSRSISLLAPAVHAGGEVGHGVGAG